MKKTIHYYLWSAVLTAAFWPAGVMGQHLGVPDQPRAISGGFHRAGNPQCVSKRAQPSRERQQGSYYIGGGRALGGQGRGATEGTWGSDYAPWYTRVSLNWTLGRHTRTVAANTNRTGETNHFD